MLQRRHDTWNHHSRQQHTAYHQEHTHQLRREVNLLVQL